MPRFPLAEPTPTPAPFRLWSGITAVAGAVERRVWAETRQNLISPNLYVLLVAPPGAGDMAARVSDKQLGISSRMVRAYDINTDQFPCRLDVLYGWATLRAELACRQQS